MRPARKTRVFIGFDFDHDQDLKNLLVGQSRFPESPFLIEDWSLKEESPKWRTQALARIRRADVVISPILDLMREISTSRSSLSRLRRPTWPLARNFSLHCDITAAVTPSSRLSESRSSPRSNRSTTSIFRREDHRPRSPATPPGPADPVRLLFIWLPPG
jgi:hypothetical protein